MTPSTRRPSIAIVGAGFSGSLLAVHLLRRFAPHIRIHLIERDPRFGRGLAYSTGNSSHLLNVPAGRMSAFSAEPGHFLSWLRSLSPEERGLPEVDEGTFVPRRLYGAYIQDLLGNALWTEGGSASLFLVADEAASLERDGDRLSLALSVGRRHAVDAAVLAVGNFPPEPPTAGDDEFYAGDFYRGDPWAPDALAGLGRTAPVLLIGTGLTMIDTVISLLDRGHRGPITALSRRGLVSQAHAPGPPAAPFLPDPPPDSVTELLCLVRAEIDRRAAEGIGWRGVIDVLRPLTQALWCRLPETERRRFLRHLRPWWEVHRHRTAPAVMARIDAARQAGQLSVCAGRILEFRPEEERVTVSCRPRGTVGEVRELSVARVINCSGPNCDYARIRDPLLRSLLDGGAIRPDALRLGIEVTGDNEAVGADGRAYDRLYAMGPVTRSAWWEITAVPDIRPQAETMAERLGAVLGLGQEVSESRS